MLPVVIVAGGPSVTISDVRLIGMARSADLCRVIAINDAVYPCWFADHLHACDAKWWTRHGGVPYFFGTKTALEETAYMDVVTLQNTGTEGFDQRQGCVRTGYNSGYQAVHIAAQGGAEHIILVGFDYSDRGARDHWFGRHGPGMDKSSDVAEWRRVFRDLTTHLNGMGVKISNVSMQSTLTWLPRYDLNSLFGKTA